MGKEIELLRDVLDIWDSISLVEIERPTGFKYPAMCDNFESIREHLRTVDAAPNPATQSESEAVELLRETTNALTVLRTLGEFEESCIVELLRKNSTFLSIPPGPDWRKLAVELRDAVQAYREIVHDMKPDWRLAAAGTAIRDALAAESAATTEVKS